MGRGSSYGLVGHGGPYGIYGYGTTYAGYFNGTVFTTATYTGSDQKLKQNIRDFTSAMDIISKLHPKQYEVNDLKTLISKGGNSTKSLSGYLKQNIPNPANNNTAISYYLPDNAGMAQIRITDIKGSLLKVYTPSKGEGQLNIKTGELPV